MKPVVSSGVLRLGVSILGVVVVAVSGVLDGVQFDQLIAGGADGWQKLFAALGIAVGGALFGWARKWIHDFSPAEFTAYFEQFLTTSKVPSVIVDPSAAEPANE